MRVKSIQMAACIVLMAVLSPGTVVGADSGVAPAWSPDWGPQPISPPVMSEMNMKGVSPAVTNSAVQVDFPGNVGPVPWAEDTLCPMPLVGTPADYARARAMAALLPQPAVPSMPLVETPHDRSVKAIEVPGGGTVLGDGTIVAGGTSAGLYGIGSFVPPMPPLPISPDGTGISAFQAPILPGP